MQKQSSSSSISSGTSKRNSWFRSTSQPEPLDVPIALSLSSSSSSSSSDFEGFDDLDASASNERGQKKAARSRRKISKLSTTLPAGTNSIVSTDTATSTAAATAAATAIAPVTNATSNESVHPISSTAVQQQQNIPIHEQDRSASTSSRTSTTSSTPSTHSTRGSTSSDPSLHKIHSDREFKALISECDREPPLSPLQHQSAYEFVHSNEVHTHDANCPPEHLHL